MWIGEEVESRYLVDFEILLERIVSFVSKEFVKRLSYFSLVCGVCSIFIYLIGDVWDEICKVFFERSGISVGILFFMFFGESGEDDVFLRESKEYFEENFVI